MQCIYRDMAALRKRTHLMGTIAEIFYAPLSSSDF